MKMISFLRKYEIYFFSVKVDFSVFGQYVM